jgi:hypothetical protein
VRTGARPDTPGERGLDVVRVLAATDVALASAEPASVGSLVGLPRAGSAPVLIPTQWAAS